MFVKSGAVIAMCACAMPGQEGIRHGQTRTRGSTRRGNGWLGTDETVVANACRRSDTSFIQGFRDATSPAVHSRPTRTQSSVHLNCSDLLKIK